MQVAEIDGDVYEALVERGWDDQDIITKEKAFDEYCNWHGLINWGPTLRQRWKELYEYEKGS